MRTMNVEIAGVSIALSLNWKALNQIESEVVDPAKLLAEAQKEIEAAEKGDTYIPAVEFKTSTAIKIFAIAAKVAEDPRTSDEIGELCVRHGIFKVQELVGHYLVALLSGESEEVPTPGKSKSPPEKS